MRISGDGAADGHGLRVRTAALQSVRRGVHRPAPEGVGEEKYDASATSMVGLLKYGTGLPFNRIEKLQGGMGIPLPAATQWDLVNAGAADARPAHEELITPGSARQICCTTTTPP